MSSCIEKAMKIGDRITVDSVDGPKAISKGIHIILFTVIYHIYAKV